MGTVSGSRKESGICVIMCGRDCLLPSSVFPLKNRVAGNRREHTPRARASKVIRTPGDSDLTTTTKDEEERVEEPLQTCYRFIRSEYLFRA